MLNSKFPVSVYLCVLGVLTTVCAQESCVPSLRPTGNLREVVISRCSLYQESVNPTPFCEENTFEPRNCTEVWESFSSAFLNQPLCNVSVERYDDYIRMTHHPIPCDTALFWENVFPFVHRFSNHGAKYFALSDTLTGYIGTGIMWCSDTDQGVSEYPTMCDSEPTSDCPLSANHAFCVAASGTFGRRASGHVHIMMNATSKPIFANDTYFALYELPFMQANVTKATVLMVNENPDPNRNKCTDPSLKELAQIFETRGIEYECMENRRDVAALLCLDNPASNVCSVLESEPEPETSGATTVNAASSLLMFALFLLSVARVLL